MKETDIRQGTLALMVLKTLEILGPLHGYAIARRIEQISGELLAVNQGTLYPVLLKLMQEGSIKSEGSAPNGAAFFTAATTEASHGLEPDSIETVLETSLPSLPMTTRTTVFFPDSGWEAAGLKALVNRPKTFCW